MDVLPAFLIGCGMFAAVVHDYGEDDGMCRRFVVGAALVALGPAALAWEIAKRLDFS